MLNFVIFKNVKESDCVEILLGEYDIKIWDFLITY